jgi:hypothetical protein
MKVKIECLHELLYLDDGEEMGDWKKIEVKLYKSFIWSKLYEIIFKHKNKRYSTLFSKGVCKGDMEELFVDEDLEKGMVEVEEVR